MPTIICKLLRVLINAGKAGAEALGELLRAGLEVLGDVGDSLLGSGIGGWLLLGAGAFILLPLLRKKEDKNDRPVVITSPG